MDKKQTANVQTFLEWNQQHPVISGQAFPGGGAKYVTKDGMSFRFTLEECRSMDMPKWDFE
jgi:hypothetical protein